MSCDCGCCTGVRATTPVAEENRPGLREIHHRPGTYATFVETMRARLSSTDFPELAPLRMRDAGDASIALCDIWAIAGDVLSFYQDRIANEGYLRTATERNSVLQLGRLTGYEMRPGVSASVYLAYTIDANAASVNIPVGTRVQSVPATGEKAQTFETAELLSARPEWSQITVRLAQPQWRAPPVVLSGRTRLNYGAQYDVLNPGRGLYLDGTSTQLKPNDALLIDYGNQRPIAYRVDKVMPDTDNKRTQVLVREWDKPAPSVPVPVVAATPIQTTIQELSKALKLQPRNVLTVSRDVATTLRPGAEAFSKMLLAHVPALKETLIPALGSVNVTTSPPATIKVYALRSKAALFGNTAPSPFLQIQPPPVIGIARTARAASTDSYSGTIAYTNLSVESAWGSPDPLKVPLDATYAQIKPGSNSDNPSWAIIDSGLAAAADPQVLNVQSVQTISMAIGSAFSAQVSLLSVDRDWLTPTSTDLSAPDLLRQAQVFAQSEELALASDPLQDNVAGDVTTNEIELDQYYSGLTPGLWVVAAGERADFTDPDVKVEVAERAMIAAVRQGLTALVPRDGNDNPVLANAANLPGDTLHTYIKLATPLAYSYRRDTFTLYGNVVRATHGETRRETLGAGDATQVFQNFTLKSPPLTYVAAPTPAGVASTLQVRVNNLLRHEVDDVSMAAPNARVYLSKRNDAEATSIVFGDGKHGARLPTGQDNVASVYRSGIGAAGNVRAGQLTLATDKPLGVTGVNNPIRASGGADADTLQQARVNAPLAVTALDRLVSVQDYADFACSFAGIGKATAVKLPGPGGDFVHVTIAGIDDIPIDTTSDLYRNLVEALNKFGDPHLPIHVDIRNALSLVIQASVSLQPDYAWDDVQPRILAALNCRFGFQARGLGQPVFGSEIIGVIQGVTGVAHVLGGTVRLLSDADLINGLTPLAPAAAANGTASDGSQSAWFTLTPAPGTSDEGSGADGWLSVPAACIDSLGKILPAQIAYLPPNVPDSLILELAS
ncbi:MAG TPA: putative baseplate assembly protein [Rudaea sp.]|jgi:hypothetical protein|uniref:putative baseplate assembly protein n=1 Tax=Rudaea sp. TaxID=2136325 RepID=UPI002F9310B3